MTGFHSGSVDFRSQIPDLGWVGLEPTAKAELRNASRAGVFGAALGRRDMRHSKICPPNSDKRASSLHCLGFMASNSNFRFRKQSLPDFLFHGQINSRFKIFAKGLKCHSCSRRAVARLGRHQACKGWLKPSWFLAWSSGGESRRRVLLNLTLD